MPRKLTKRIVEGVRPTAADIFLWDDEVPGFVMYDFIPLI